MAMLRGTRERLAARRIPWSACVSIERRPVSRFYVHTCTMSRWWGRSQWGGGELERLGWLGVRVMEPGGF